MGIQYPGAWEEPRMNYRIYILFILLYMCESFAADGDSSDIIFDDSKIHHYEIQSLHCRLLDYLFDNTPVLSDFVDH